ncbi:MAG: bifunctional folylpolyglutamate synthase/dihydrofolate synthase [Ruminococcus sp.]|uniref:bifunctional folylpolyglutamate synthase/dihydrofolate synthase n=1 Tax=Ruminococcus sp. TaxID=41978 RepID=UPI0025F9CB76|nr:folylpolyglutamate synthase/dihydrofolate synthase family protein [Ruminococcus sp.]MCR4795670.1 bifunctional folylpolyglutamate synthase/dihydrofolate synthase [Ruminococcus sp.]
MNYTDALSYMKKAAERGSVLGLSRITELLRLMGDPQERVRTVHISGTNGKGSFGAMLTSVLKNAGYRVGGFSSPAITKVTDSFRINGVEISEEDFADIIGDIAPICESMDEKSTEFEVLTAAAFELFERRGCDIAIVECGMGGDLDSTNVIKAPVLSVITNVQKDHSAFLGNTVAEIASHKAGIIKKGRPVYFGGNSEEAYEVIADAAEKQGSELFLPDYSGFEWSEDCCDINGADFAYKGENLHIPLLGTYQLENAVNVISCVEILRREGFSIPCEAVKKGLAEVKWHGRFEVLSKKPLIIYDGAHNPDGIRCAADSISRYFGDKKVALLIGVMADKEYGLYADMLGELAEIAFAIKPANPRSLDSQKLADTLNAKGLHTEPFSVLAEGVKAAYSYVNEHDVPLVILGSLYMYSEVTEALGNL